MKKLLGIVVLGYRIIWDTLAKELGLSGGNNNLRFLSDNPLKQNTAGWIYL